MKTIGFTLLCLFVVGSLSPLLAVDEQRQAYEKMVEKSTREADEYLQEKQKKLQGTETEAQTRQEAELEDRVRAEQDRIKTEMEKVRNRGLGPNFTQGMKDNQLEQLQDKMDQLMSDPKVYFNR